MLGSQFIHVSNCGRNTMIKSAIIQEWEITEWNTTSAHSEGMGNNWMEYNQCPFRRDSKWHYWPGFLPYLLNVQFHLTAYTWQALVLVITVVSTCSISREFTCFFWSFCCYMSFSFVLAVVYFCGSMWLSIVPYTDWHWGNHHWHWGNHQWHWGNHANVPQRETFAWLPQCHYSDPERYG